jgi:hypothetical protein
VSNNKPSKKPAKASGKFLANLFPDLLFDPEDGVGTFFRKAV